MTNRYDAIIVGAGPAGSYTAYRLATLGYQVLVVEEHQEVGQPVHCSGLIGAEAFDRFGLPRRSIIRGFDCARFISPGGFEALVTADRTVAYVVRRDDFDRSLAELAREAGAVYRLGWRCLKIEPAGEGLEVYLRHLGGALERLKAKTAVVATGADYRLGKGAGWARPYSFVNTAQAEITMNGVTEVEVYLGSQISPGSFAWAIPLSGKRTKVGVCNERRARPYLERLLRHPRIGERLEPGRFEIKIRPIPIVPARRTFFDRTLLVGDAAGQVKPTTAGGIGYAIVCAEAAAETLDWAFRRGDLTEKSLSIYQRRWSGAIGSEIRIGRFFRLLGGRLSDSQIDRLVRAYRDPEFRDLVRRTADFEKHSRFIAALLASPIFWTEVLNLPRLRRSPGHRLRRAS